jgi:uncharacterized protein
MPILTTLVLLVLSNVFMTFAWYWHLKGMSDKPLWIVVPFSWGIALFEYMLMVPANRIGYTKAGLTGFQLKIAQEVITLAVFTLFALLVLKEHLRWNYIVSFGLLILAAWFAFAFKEPASP